MDSLRKELSKTLGWESAHVSFGTATRGLDTDTIGKRPTSLPYSIWELAWHIRFAQKDVVDFCLGSGYKAPNWPDDYWPESAAPQSREDWEECLRAVDEDRQRMRNLINDKNQDLFEPFPHGDGQHLFREALLIIDHEAYHTGQIVLIRKLLGKWE